MTATTDNVLQAAQPPSGSNDPAAGHSDPHWGGTDGEVIITVPAHVPRDELDSAADQVNYDSNSASQGNPLGGGTAISESLTSDSDSDVAGEDPNVDVRCT